MSVTYMTRQQQAVLSCVESCADGCTAAELTELLHAQGQSVGLTTVYRQLEKLEQRGIVHKIVTDQGARYQYCHAHEHEHACFIIKCEQCGRMEHAACAHLDELYGHLSEEHHFRINPRRTLFYGLCQSCAQEVEA